MRIEQIFTSPGHNYFGHHDQPSGDFPLVAATSVECVAGRGIWGDRFFDYQVGVRLNYFFGADPTPRTYATNY